MTIQHSAITDPEIHEPKGISTAPEGSRYIADGLGSGTWKLKPHGAFYYFNVGTGTTFTTPTSYTLINPVTTGDSNPVAVTHNGAGRLTYTGTPLIDGHMTASICFKHSTGAGTDIYFAIYKNGVATGVEWVQAANSTNYTTCTFVTHFNNVATNDYFEVYVKCSTGNVTVHGYNVVAIGTAQ